MIPLFRDPGWTFRFADDRLVSRFHLDGAEPGRPVTVVALGAGDVLATAVVGADGWVQLATPLVVRAGGGFVARLG